VHISTSNYNTVLFESVLFEQHRNTKCRMYSLIMKNKEQYNFTLWMLIVLLVSILFMDIMLNTLTLISLVSILIVSYSGNILGNVIIMVRIYQLIIEDTHFKYSIPWITCWPCASYLRYGVYLSNFNQYFTDVFEEITTYII
jgi:hypothetical protein